MNAKNNNKIDSVLRNDSTRIVQPEILIRTDSLGQTNGGNAIDRKGSLTIGQSVFYTDYPPKDAQSGKLLNMIITFLISGILLSVICGFQEDLNIRSVACILLFSIG